MDWAASVLPASAPLSLLSDVSPLPQARELAHSWGPRMPWSPAGSELSPSKSSLTESGSVSPGQCGVWREVHWQEVRKEGRGTYPWRLFILRMFEGTAAKPRLGGRSERAPPSVNNPALSGGHEVLCQI